MITPFGADGIDYARMGRLLDFQAENGTKAIVVAGTTGEIATLEAREYERLVDDTVRQTAGRMKVIVGVGGNNTARCVANARLAARCGADAVLQTAPYYNKTTQEGLVAHFSRVADASTLPLILYNVPGRTAIGITAESYQQLAAHPNINGVKEASGDFSLIARIAAECGDALFLWSGNDDNTLPMMALGARGVVSVASNLVPAAVAALCGRCLSGDYPAALALQKRYSALFRALFYETNPIPVKAAMALCGMDSGRLRLPLVPMSEKNLARLRESMVKLDLLPQ
jgi:4-hydroxy-tetrahydrodipicolinate synthase